MTTYGAKEPSEAISQARAKAGELAAAFAEVFGLAKTRTGRQRIVLDHLGTCAGDDANSYRFNEGRDGIALIAAGIHRDGAKSLLKVIDRQLLIAQKSKQPQAGKPRVITKGKT